MNLLLKMTSKPFYHLNGKTFYGINIKQVKLLTVLPVKLVHCKKSSEKN
jgi:hypothetical protein